MHSDGGAQYAAKRFRALLKRQKFVQSMTRKDNHYDNAYAESVFSRFKTELMVRRCIYWTQRCTIANLRVYAILQQQA